MIHVALRGLLGRKLRSILTAFAIVLGVAMMSGTYVLTDTIDAAFKGIFEDSYANTDAVVSGKGADISFQGTQAETPPFPEEILDQVLELPSVGAASGTIVDETNADILTKEGKAVDTDGAPSFGFGIDPAADSRFNPLRLLAGAWAENDGEVVIDVETADNQGYEVGDTVRIATLQPVEEFTVTGLAQYGEVRSLGTATFAVFTIPEAQRLFDREGQLDQIPVAAAEGTTPEELVADLKAALPADQVTVRSAAEQTDEDLESVAFLDFIRYFLLSFAIIALIVGGFVIFNTLSITVAQRTREFATLRTIGASRRQLLSSVIIESLVIGIIASVIGLFAGFGLAIGLKNLADATGGGLPTSDYVFAPRTVIVSILVGVIVTLLAGLFPALRATRVPPIAAVREGAELPRGRFARYTPFVAGVLLVIALFLLGQALFRDEMDTAPRLLSIAGGVLLLFIGVAMLSRWVVKPLAGLTAPIGRWALVALSILLYPITFTYWLLKYGLLARHASRVRRALALAWSVPIVELVALFLVGLLLTIFTLGGLSLASPWAFLGLLIVNVIAVVMWRRGRIQLEWPEDLPPVLPDRSVSALSKENSRRNTGRTASSAAALMIGVALVTFVAVLANGFKASNRDAIESQVQADFVITAQDGFTPFVPGAGDALAASGAADEVSPVRSGLGKVSDSDQYVTGIDPEAISQFYTFDWADGSDDEVLTSLGSDGAIVSKEFAESNDLEVGSSVELLSADNETAQLEVKGIYEPPPFYPILGAVSISKETFDSLYERPRDQFVFANTGGDTSEATVASINEAVAEFPDAKVQTRDAWITEQDEEFNDFLTFIYVLLLLAVIVSLFGMVNTLVLTVFERTREIGMLRAVGMTRRQTRRMIRNESVITALIGAALGLPLGIFLAVLVTKALSQFDVKVAVPWVQLIIFTVVAIVVGVLAAIAPARRAAKLNVLRALQYE